VVPARLLLSPLFGRLEGAAWRGPAAVCQLLGMVRDSMAGMDGTAVATYYEAVFAFLLKALDLRRAPTAALAADRYEKHYRCLCLVPGFLETRPKLV
jgi:hypothetical protein